MVLYAIKSRTGTPFSVMEIVEGDPLDFTLPPPFHCASALFSNAVIDRLNSADKPKTPIERFILSSKLGCYLAMCNRYYSVLVLRKKLKKDRRKYQCAKGVELRPCVTL